MLAQRWEGSAGGMGLTVLVGGLDRGVWEVLTGLGGTPCMTESRVPGRPRSGRGDERMGRPSPCSPGLCCVLHVSTPCGASRSLGEEGGPPRLHVLCWALGAWGPTCRFLVQVQRLPPGHAQAHAQGVWLHPPAARHQQGGLRQRPEHRCVPPRATCTRAPCFPCWWASGGTSTGSESSVWKLALPPRGVHSKVVHQVHEFRPCLRHLYFAHWLK